MRRLYPWCADIVICVPLEVESWDRSSKGSAQSAAGNRGWPVAIFVIVANMTPISIPVLRPADLCLWAC